MSSVIYYYIPEDKEEPDKLNAFVISKDIDSIKIDDVKENFPLPGDYYFRFKFKFQNKNVWIDFNNPDAVLPRFDGKVIMKVTRISWSVEESSSISKENFGDFLK
jgi:hypothetical protein